MLTPFQKRKQIHFFQILDFDRNGLIQRKDFEDIAENLSVFDTDHNGYISLNEYLDLFIGLRIEVRFAPMSFAKLDLNQDGQISKNELVKSVEEFLKSNDPSASGNWLFGHWEL